MGEPYHDGVNDALCELDCASAPFVADKHLGEAASVPPGFLGVRLSS